MADETPPLSETQLEQMRGYAEGIRTAKHAIGAVSSELVHASDYMLTLLAEVARLRTENAKLSEERERWSITAVNGYERVADHSMTIAELRAENDAMREAIVDCPVFASLSADCPWCDEFHESYAPADPRSSHPHAPHCPVVRFSR